jgi:hypothetical protein
MMFTSNKVSQSMLDAVSKVLAEEEVQPKKKLILEPEKPKVKVEEEDEKKAKSPFDWKDTPRTTLKPGERTGHEHKKTATGNVFIKKYKKEKMEEEADCVTEPKAKEIAKKEVKGHEKSMHKEDVEQIDEISKSTLGSYVKAAARDVGASRKLAADFENKAEKSRKPSAKAAATRISDKFKVTALKRHVGIGKAVERLTKEEFSIESFMAEEFTEEQLDEMINEVLSKSAKAGDWIHDFVHSDNPKFSGKSKEKRKQMALAAYYAKQRNEEVEELDETGPVYDPLVKKGTYELTHANKTKKFKAVDTANAKWKMGKHLGVDYTKIDNDSVKEIEPPVRKSNLKKEEVEQMDEIATLGDYGGMHVEDEIDPSERTTDTLKGRVKGGKHNQHSTYKVNLKAEEAVDEMKRPLDGDTFVTNEESPLKLAKDIAKKSFRKIRQETMMGKAGATSEETENE